MKFPFPSSLFTKYHPQPTFVSSEADRIILYLKNNINREDLIAESLSEYKKIKFLPEPEKEYTLIPLYISLENFITTHKSLTVKQEYTKASLREYIRTHFDMSKLSSLFRLIFLPEIEQSLYLYEKGVSDLSEYISQNLGTQVLENILNGESNITLKEKHIDFTALHPPPTLVKIEGLTAVFNNLYNQLFLQLKHSFGSETATKLALKTYTFIQSSYDIDLISRYLQIVPDEFLLKERIQFLTRESLEKLIAERNSALLLAKQQLEEKIEVIKKQNEDLKNTQNALEEAKKNVEQKVIERTRELAEEQVRLRSSVNSMSLGFVMTNKEFKSILINPAMDMIFDHMERPFVLDDFAKAVSGSLNLYESLLKCQTEKTSLKMTEVSLGDKCIRLFLSPILMLDGEIIGTVILVENMTAEKELERMKLDFVSMAAHELRTPLTSIQGYLSVFIEENANILKGEKAMFLDRIQTSTRQLMGLIENLLSASRIEKGNLTVQLIPADLSLLVEDVVTGLVEQAKSKQQILIFDKPKEKLPLVLIDHIRIEEVVTNLIANAIAYTPLQGQINVSITPFLDNSKEKPSYLAVSIKDTGEGIPQEAIPHLFTKFFRVSGTLEQGSKGTGLGLFISKSIVNMHKGKIWVESEYGKGSTFTFTLPIAGPEDMKSPDITSSTTRPGIMLNPNRYSKLASK